MRTKSLHTPQTTRDPLANPLLLYSYSPMSSHGIIRMCMLGRSRELLVMLITPKHQNTSLRTAPHINHAWGEVGRGALQNYIGAGRGFSKDAYSPDCPLSLVASLDEANAFGRIGVE